MWVPLSVQRTVVRKLNKNKLVKMKKYFVELIMYIS